MKHISLIAAVLLLLTACATKKSVTERMDDFVNEAEKESAAYSVKDWEESKAEYEALLTEYSEHADEFTDEDRDKFAKSVGRYHSLLLLNGIEEAASSLKMLKDILPSYLEGFEEAVEENKEDFLGAIENMISSSEIDKTVDGVLKEIDNFANEAADEIEKRMDDLTKELERMFEDED
ncbi:MAG: hypothetical protein IKT15_02010 [Firmicutes bacterium]|nr:hypothetical protein [Bacillota bacterium]